MAHVAQDSTTIKRLRQSMGIVGMLLPFVITIGHSVHSGRFDFPSSISGAYYTNMRDVLVGSLSAVGVFLIFYRYTRLDDILGTIAGVAAIAVALFPTEPGAVELMVASADGVTGKIHAVAATVLFLSLAAFCFFLFPRSIRPHAMTPRKKARNVTYYICGVLIIAGLALAALGSRILPDSVEAWLRPLFWGQTIAVLAFGVAWFAKSNTLFPDVES